MSVLTKSRKIANERALAKNQLWMLSPCTENVNPFYRDYAMVGAIFKHVSNGKNVIDKAEKEVTVRWKSTSF